jgi:hypothetical protein
VRPLRGILPLALVLAGVSGCGNERIEPRSPEIDPSQPSRTVRYPAAGLTVDLPRGFGVRRTPRPGVFRATLGESFVSAFAYRRAEQLPRDDEELDTARGRLERTIKARSKDYRLRSARSTRVAGARAVEVVGDQTLSSRRLRTRSLHVFKGETEYVIELAAPTRAFPRVDRAVTPRVKRTLKLRGTVRSARGRSARR